ncbi:hypothetical protein Mgra_00007588 [Meloidogyne graminicola]|uniref:Uncharacterized protein n=1 Tax=Meloidogyne graminicola TaxID=189291 RepID=A0A8S9ZI77_9BILA|nr:hypothetical protein Mgra_00007588 [Meloidogyne graminicola]
MLLLFTMIARLRFSRFFEATQTQKLDEKSSFSVAGINNSNQREHQNKKSNFRVLLFAHIPLWLLLLFGCILFASTMVEFLAMQSINVGETTIVSNEGKMFFKEELTLNGFEEEDENENNELFNKISEREQREIVGDPVGGQTLKKFEVIRELGYQFHSLISPLILSGWTLFFLLILLLVFLCSMLLSLLAILIGINQRFYRYSPMEHLSTKRLNTRTKRVKRLLIGTGLTLLCGTPITIILGSTFLIHSHSHTAVCIMEQKMRQETSINEYVNSVFTKEEQTEIVPEFLKDFVNERISLAEENCKRDRIPLENAWSSSLLISLASISFGFCLMQFASNWNCTEKEGSVSLRAYVPGWLQNSALTPDSYSSIPELRGSNGTFSGSLSSGRHPSNSTSQCSLEQELLYTKNIENYSE